MLRIPFLGLRSNILGHIKARIIERCVDAQIVDVIESFDPRTWRGVMTASGLEYFFGDFLKDETFELTTTYWPEIDSEAAWLGLETVKRFWFKLYGKRADIPIPRLRVFAKAVLSGHPQSSMDSVCRLLASMMAILPTAMGVEGQNSVSTLAFSDHRKSTICSTLHDIVNVKVNGPPLAHFDPRPIANKLTDKAHKYPVDVAKHLNQPEIKPFFKKAEDDNLEDIEDQIVSILIGTKLKRNINQKLMDKHIGVRDRAISPKQSLQQNITAYFMKKKAADSLPNDSSPPSIPVCLLCLILYG